MKMVVVTMAIVVALAVAYTVGVDADSPAFCNIRFGTSNPTEAIFACEGSSLLVFRRCDLGSQPERYQLLNGTLEASISIPPFRCGNKTYTVNQCYEHIETEPSSRHSLMIHVAVSDGETQFKQYCDVVVSQDRRQLDIAHFDGQLSVVPQAFDWVTIKKSLVIGGEPTDLRVVVGSFNKSAGCWTVMESGSNDEYNFPDSVLPVATVEFPSDDPESPIVERFPLDQFC